MIIEILLILLSVTVAILGHWILVLKDKIKVLKKNPEQTPQGYDKFIQDSRDAAFGYIEQVQLCIVDLKEKTESDNKAEIKESYNRLISLLPEEK